MLLAMLKVSGKISDLIQTHMEKNLSGMATGAYINRPYSKWLLRFIQSQRFTLFAWYRIVFGSGVLALALWAR